MFFAFVFEESGNLAEFEHSPNQYMPLVACCDIQLEKLRPLANLIEKKTGRRLSLQKRTAIVL